MEHCAPPGPTATAVIEHIPAGTVKLYVPGVEYKHRVLNLLATGTIFSISDTRDSGEPI
jgi:hypothetical protein